MVEKMGLCLYITVRKERKILHFGGRMGGMVSGNQNWFKVLLCAVQNPVSKTKKIQMIGGSQNKKPRQI